MTISDTNEQTHRPDFRFRAVHGAVAVFSEPNRVSINVNGVIGAFVHLEHRVLRDIFVIYFAYYPVTACRVSRAREFVYVCVRLCRWMGDMSGGARCDHEFVRSLQRKTAKKGQLIACYFVDLRDSHFLLPV